MKSSDDIAATGSDVADLKRQLSSLERQYFECRRELDAVYQSKSWRIAALLRKIASLKSPRRIVEITIRVARTLTRRVVAVLRPTSPSPVHLASTTDVSGSFEQQRAHLDFERAKRFTRRS